MCLQLGDLKQNKINNMKYKLIPKSQSVRLCAHKPVKVFLADFPSLWLLFFFTAAKLLMCTFRRAHQDAGFCCAHCV